MVIEADELWSFVGAKRQVWWAWVARGARTRQGAGMTVGDRDEFTAECLWDSLPRRYRNRAVGATDLVPVYRAAIPTGQHAPAGTEAGATAHVERLFGTLRQRCARFVRRTLSSSRKLENHVGALWYFVREYNLRRA